MRTSRAEEPTVQRNGGLWSNDDPRGIWMLRIDNDIGVTTCRDDAGDEEESRSAILDPGTAEILGNRRVEGIVPTWTRGGIEKLARDISRNERLDKTRAAGRRLPVRMNQNLDEA